MSTDIIRKVSNEIMATIVMHTRFKNAYDGILYLLETANCVEIPLGATVIAPPGCGKTALIKTITRAIPSNNLLGGELRTIHVAAEASATQGHFIGKILKELGYPSAIRPTTLYEQSNVIARAFRERGVKMLFIDEFQHVCRGKRTLSAAGITDWIKQLADEGGVVVVMLGTRELKEISEMNDQLGSRSPAKFELREFERNEEWVGLLQEMARQVRSFDLSPIHQIFYKQLHAACDGTLRSLKQLLITASKVAIEANKSSIDKQSLITGYDMVFGTDAKRANPFLS